MSPRSWKAPGCTVVEMSPLRHGDWFTDCILEYLGFWARRGKKKSNVCISVKEKAKSGLVSSVGRLHARACVCARAWVHVRECAHTCSFKGFTLTYLVLRKKTLLDFFFQKRLVLPVSVLQVKGITRSYSHIWLLPSARFSLGGSPLHGHVTNCLFHFDGHLSSLCTYLYY